VLRRISLRLAQDGIDIADLYGARNDAAATFETCLALRIPNGVNVARLKADLDQLLQGDALSVGLFRSDVLRAVSEPQPLMPKPRLKAGAPR
jgi:hypothetical protein